VALMQLTSKHFEIEPLTEGVYAAIARPGGLARSNAGIVDLGDRVLVFDLSKSPQTGRDLIAVGERLIGHPVTLAINSHWHVDHVLGNQALTSTTTLISTPRTRNLIAERIPPRIAQDKDQIPRLLAELEAKLQSETNPDKRRQLSKEIDYYRMIIEDLPGLRCRVPEVTFQGKVTFHGLSRRVDLFTFGGGHTESDAMLYLPDDQILFVADLLFTDQHPWIGDGDPDEWLRIYDRIDALEPRVEVVVPGHGSVATPDAFAAMRRYIPMLKQLADEIIKSGGTPDDAESRPIPAAFSDWGGQERFARNLRFVVEWTLAQHGS
jgi:cyclase